MKGCPKPATQERLEVGGNAVAFLTYPDCPHRSGLYHFWVVFVHGRQGYEVVWFNTREHQADDRGVFDGMLSSVSFEAS